MRVTNDAALKQYWLLLGQVVCNLQSLEFLLRVFLDQVDTERYGTYSPILESDVTVGGHVKANYLTNYDSLTELVDRYNEVVKKRKRADLTIGQEIVELRDAIAHGRVIGKTPEPPPRLYRFGKPKNGRVPVVCIIDFTEEWARENRGRTHLAFLTVKQACDLFLPGLVE